MDTSTRGRTASASRRGVKTLGAFLAASMMVACSPSGPSPTPGPTATGATTASSLASTPVTASSSSVSPDATAIASTGALDAYRRFWASRVAAQEDPTKPVPDDLAKYAIDTALTDEQAAIVLYRQQGIQFRGAPRLEPRVTGVDLVDPPKVSITDCVDSTDWTPVYAATGASARAPGRPTRLVVESMATTYAGRWVIRTATVFRDRPC